MRSPRGFAAAIALLLGVPLAFAANVIFGGGASEILHLALGASFLIQAVAVFDFRLPQWMTVAASAAIGVLGVIFLLQAISDLTLSAPIANLAYGVLGQYLEKALGYAFLAWCVALLAFDSRGGTRVLGGLALAVVLCVEIYSYAAGYLGGEASPVLKLLYLPVFVWLLVESRKAPEVGT